MEVINSNSNRLSHWKWSAFGRIYGSCDENKEWESQWTGSFSIEWQVLIVTVVNGLQVKCTSWKKIFDRITHAKLCSFILEDQNKKTVNTVDNTGFQKLFWPKYLFALHLRIKNIKRIPIKNYTHVIKLLSFAIVIIPV